jgi:ATP-dependent Clp protease adapter protein ClpS
MNPQTPQDPEPRTPSVPLKQYDVVLHRSEDKGLLFVVRAIMALTHTCKEEATQTMWEAYHRGWSVVTATHLERAELLVEQFAESGLRTTLQIRP